MSIAIEPMTAEPDALNHHRGLIVIPPGEERTFNFGFRFHEKMGIEL
jgi:aldose 1-epimerase